MSSIRKMGIVLAAAMLVSVAGAAQAQDAIVKANVPFAFVVHGQNMPAGKYVIQRDSLEPSLLLIRGDDKANHNATFVLTIRDGGKDPSGSEPVLLFKRYENTYQLTGVWDSRDEGFDVPTR